VQLANANFMQMLTKDEEFILRIILNKLINLIFYFSYAGRFSHCISFNSHVCEHISHISLKMKLTEKGNKNESETG
jgi:hypothetical protein